MGAGISCVIPVHLNNFKDEHPVEMVLTSSFSKAARQNLLTESRAFKATARPEFVN